MDRTALALAVEQTKVRSIPCGVDGQEIERLKFLESVNLKHIRTYLRFEVTGRK